MTYVPINNPEHIETWNDLKILVNSMSENQLGGLLHTKQISGLYHFVKNIGTDEGGLYMVTIPVTNKK